MSHSKPTKKGKSLYLDAWNPTGKKYIHTCALCGKQGYSPALEEPDFCDDSVRRAVYRELKTLFAEPLPLDAWGHCPTCAARVDKK